MTTLELKKALIHQINEINDVSFLKNIKRILDLKTDTEVMPLTQEQKDGIIESDKIRRKKIYDFKHKPHFYIN